MACQSTNSHVVFSEGRLTEGYGLGISTSGNLSGWVQPNDDGMCMIYPSGQEWGAVFITVGEPTDPPRPSENFSDYQRLSLELRGQVGGETVLIALKDNHDPDDGTETQVRASGITTNWQSFEFDLERFSNADREQLYVVIEFLFEEIPQTVCFRNIRYIP
ncbi:MAG: hypothetical protein F6K42_05245 [Leptolyngbya sp. SIO1D8]|nr:hypothetical protein [Leptolyngbya sp. SIO1D8]